MGDSIRSVELTKRQRNDIFVALEANGVDPADCELTSNLRMPSATPQHVARVVVRRLLLPTRVGTVIAHAPTNSRFYLTLQPYEFRWYVTDGPDSEAWNECDNWADVLHQVGNWAGEVRDISNMPDLWAQLKRTPQILASVEQADASNAPFTREEQAEISHRLDEIKQLLRENPDLTGEQLAAIEQTTDEIKEASTRVGRKDWVALANGALLSLIVNDVVPPHIVQSVFNLLITGIGHLFGVGGIPPVITP
jgi:hypothetical protein